MDLPKKISDNNTGQLGGRGSRRSLLVEICLTTVIVLAISHGLYLARGNALVGPRLSYLVAYLLMGAPILVLWFRRRRLDFFEFGLKELWHSFIVFLVTALIVFPPFLLAAHVWQLFIMGRDHFVAAGFPNMWNVALTQLLLIALPEEFFFRGYMQSAFNIIFSGRRRILGVQMGWGLLVTAAVFAFAHSMITYQWWHFSIFFPALIFGYLRERTGYIIAPTFFHAASNLLMDWLVRSYV